MKRAFFSGGGKSRPSKSKNRDAPPAKTRGDAKKPSKPFTPPSRPRVEGFIKRHPDGFGFFIPDDRQIQDVYISRQHMEGVMTNDRVLVEISEGRDKDRLFGEIIRVVQRAVKQVVGRYLPVDQKYGVILDDGKGWGRDLRIPADDSLGAKEGDLVVIEITRYPGHGGDFVGRVVSIIGDSEDPLNDVMRVIYGHHIPNEFSEKAKREAKSYGGRVSEEEMSGRVDLRELGLITIDGATARDFDDAIYVEKTEQDFHVWVAIADVSHYVRPGTTLDEEAFERGTSTYFPNFVVPMLPEELSNELCSLNPHVPRLCFVCEMHVDFQGEITSHKFYEGVMKSRARVTYGEAQEVIDGHTPEKLKPVEANILEAAGLAKILMARRFKEGSLDLEIPETQVVVDSTGRTIDIIRSERLFAHRLIEELMLIANISTARYIAGNGVPGIYRIHAEPAEENIQALQRYLYNFGGKAGMGSGKLQKKLTRALQSFEGKPEYQILNILTLRTMNQAKYSNENIGHFGLGFTHYSHFTSPIRRYPDLIAHRIIKSLLYPKYRNLRPTEEGLATATTMLSACEQRSVKAERQLISIKKARFIHGFLGEEFEGIISSVNKFGIFVLLRKYDVDGLVKLEALGDDRWVFDDENLRLVGKHTGKSYNIGETIQVQVASVDADAGKIDFILAGQEESSLAEGPKRASHQNSDADRKDVQKRRTPQNDRGCVRKERVSKRRRKGKTR